MPSAVLERFLKGNGAPAEIEGSYVKDLPTTRRLIEINEKRFLDKYMDKESDLLKNLKIGDIIHVDEYWDATTNNIPRSEQKKDFSFFNTFGSAQLKTHFIGDIERTEEGYVYKGIMKNSIVDLYDFHDEAKTKNPWLYTGYYLQERSLGFPYQIHVG